MDCACGSYLRRNGEASAALGDNHSVGGASVMDASFVHLPPSLLVQSDDREVERALQHRVHPLHLEYLEGIVNQTIPSSELCLYCVQR